MSLRVGKPGLGFGVAVTDTRPAFAIFASEEAIFASEEANEDLTKEASR
jgi:hypothetical protein